MLKYHMTDDFKVGRCTAKKNKCRYLRDDETTHFSTEQEALLYSESKMKELEQKALKKKSKEEKISYSAKPISISLREDGSRVFNVVQKPSIYGFISTKLNEVNDAYIVKVGYTSRPVQQRFKEWKEEGGIYSEEFFQEEFVVPAVIKDPVTGKEHYVMDHNFHKYFERNGFQKLIDRKFNNAGTEHISKEFYIGEDGKKRITQEIIDDCVKDQEQNIHNSGSGYTFYDESEQKMITQYFPVNDFKPRSFQNEVIEKTSNYFLNHEDDDNEDGRRYLLTAPTRSGKSFMAAQSLLKTFDEAKKKDPSKKNHCAVVVSGFAEIEDEWKKTFQTHKDFNQLEAGTAEENKCGVSPCICPTKFKYLSKSDLTNNPNAVEDAYAAGAENVVVFLTLQDLAGSTSGTKIKPEHKFLETPGAVDMLLGDEAHLAMFTEDGRYQEALNGYGETEVEVKQNIDSLEKLDNNLNDKAQKEASNRLQQIKPNLGSLFITATPYNVLSNGSEFDIDKNVTIITEEQIIEEQKDWLVNNPGKEAWESPYYGLPEKKFFGLDVGIPANELFNPVDTKDGSKGFTHQRHVQQVISGLFGKENGLAPNIMQDDNFGEAGIGNNVYATLPYCASCDAMEAELKKFLKDNNMEDEYEILNISSAKGNSHPITKLSSQEINQRIGESKKKTITLTVNRMGTGVTQEKWDTVLMMRGMTSAQQFEQTAGRCGTPYVKEYSSNVDSNICRNCGNNEVRAEKKRLCESCFIQGGQELEDSFPYEKIKDCPKPNVAVVTFDPVSMVEFKRNKAVSLVGNKGKTVDEHTSGESVDESLDRSLTDIEHFIYRHDMAKLQQLDKNNIMEWVLKGMQNRSVGDIADGIKIHADLSGLDANAKSLLETVESSGFTKKSQKTAATSRMTENSDGKCWVDGCGENVRDGLTEDGNAYRLCENHYQIEQQQQKDLREAEKKPAKERTDEEKALISERQELENKIRNTYARTLLYAMISESNEMGVRTVIDEIRAAMPSEENGFVEGRAAEMARHLDLDIRVLELIRDNNIGGLQLDDSIRQMELILSDANDTTNKWDKFKLALNSFNSLSKNEILTPRKVSSMLVDKLDLSEKDWSNFKNSRSGTIDVGCKSAVNLVEFYDRGLANGLSRDELKDKMFSIPTSGASYELISKIYEEYGWDKGNILFVDGVSNLDTLKAISLAKEIKECQAVDPESCQYHGSSGRGTTTAKLNRVKREIFDKIDDEKITKRLEELMDKVRDMPKFDFVVSNPPYQIETVSKSGKSVPQDIYYKFQEQALIISDKSIMIYPSKRWLQQAGSNSKKFGKEFLANKGIVSIDHFEKSTDVFQGIQVHDGISIVFWNSKFSNNGEIILNNEKASIPSDGSILIINSKYRHVIEKIKSKKKPSISESSLGRGTYGVESNQLKIDPNFMSLSGRNERVDPNFIKILTIGNSNSPEWFNVEKHKIKKGIKTFSDWKIILSSSHPVRDFNSTRELLQPGEIYGRARVGLRHFKTKEEAKNFYAYTSTKFFESTFKLSPDGLHQMGVFVPDLEDYTDNNPDINWKLPLDPQLYKLFDLTEEEIKVIEEG